MAKRKNKETMLSTSPLGYLLCRIIRDKNNTPIDIEIIETNSAFEGLFQMKSETISGELVSNIDPHYLSEHPDCFPFFESISKNRVSSYFERYEKMVKKWFNINAFYNNNDCYTILFQDITDQKIISEALEKFTSFNINNVDYNYIAERAKDISGAKYVIFNKYIEYSNSYRCIGISKFNESLEKAISTLGFDFRDKTWIFDKSTENIIFNQKTTRFESFSDLAGMLVPKKIINNAARIFGLDHCYLVRSTVDNTILGDFILAFGKKTEFKNKELMETYSDMVGMLVNRLNIEQSYTNVHQEYQSYKSFSELVVNNTSDTIAVISYSMNPVYEYVSPSVFKNIGYSPEFFSGKHVWDLDIIHPDDKTKLQNLLVQYHDQSYDFKNAQKKGMITENLEYRLKDISGKWITVQSSATLAGNQIIIVERNITESKELEQEITDLFYINLDILCTFDKKGNFKKASDEWYNLLGYREKDLKLLNLRDIVHPEDYDATLYALVKLTGNKKITHVVNRCRHNNGSYRILEWRINKTGDNFVASARDITTRKQAENEIAHITKMQELLIKISSDYINVNIEKIDEIINHSLAEIGSFVKAERAYVYEYQWDKNIIKNTYVWLTEKLSLSDFQIQKIPMEQIKSFVDIHKKGELVSISNINDLSDQYSIKEFYSSQRVKSIITIPMMNNGQCIGFVGFDTIYNFQYFSEKEEVLLGIFAEMLVNMKNRVKSHQMISRQFDIQKLITSISSDFVGANPQNIDSKIKSMLREIAHFFDADRTFIIHFNDETQEAYFTNEWCDERFLTKLKKNHKLSYKTIPWLLNELRKNQAVNIPEVKELPKEAESEKKTCIDINIKSFLWIPISYKNKILGCLSFDAVKSNKIWDTNEIKVLQVIANIYAESISKVQIEKELIEAKNIAESANKAKTEFLSNMSHEIRTPLNGVIGFTELLKNTSLNSIQQEYLSNAITSANSLLGIISDILDFSKIEAGKLDLEFIKTDLINLVESASDIIKIHAAKKNLELLLNIQPETPRYAVVDPVRLKQILVNLLNNAVKFTSIGEVELGLSYKKINDQKGYFTFTVRDTGIGISEIESKKLFKAFSQADTSTTRRYGGTGLGLVISNSLAHQMGSSIHFESEEGVGTVFHFTIETEFETEDTYQLNQIDNLNRVLIIDDNQNNRSILNHSLKYWGIDCYEAESGMDAIKIMEDEKPIDAFIVDFHMPLINGIDTIKLIQKNENFKKDQQSIILLHSSSDEQINQEGIQNLNIRFTLTKPVKPNELFFYLKNLKTQYKIQDLPENIEEQTPDDISETTELTILVAEDIKMNYILINNLLKKMYPNVNILEASNGKEAVEMVKSKIPDIILMDVQMPIMDGIEATRQIKRIENGKYSNIPIVALTAGVSKKERDECFQSGMSDFIAKPIDRSLLENVIHNIVNQENNIPLAKPTIIDDTPSQIQFHNEFNQLAKSEISNLLTELNFAIVRYDQPEIARLAHALKGAFLNLKWDKIASITKEMETQNLEMSILKPLWTQLMSEWNQIKKSLE